MNDPTKSCRRLLVSLLFVTAASLVPPTTLCQGHDPVDGKTIYDQIKAFPLNGGAAEVKGLEFTRDRVRMSFDGTFYFAAPVAGQVTGAVFVGKGRFTADVPPNEFELDNVRRLLNADVVDSDFTTAVLRFSDDTFARLGQTPTNSTPANERAQNLANESQTRTLKETGVNLAARIALSLLNQEKPGFFFGTFDGGKRGRFNLVLDYQSRIPVSSFGINGGEKGLIFAHESSIDFNEVWLAFYGQEDYQRGTVSYSDVDDLIDIAHYDMSIDLRQHKKAMTLLANLTSLTRVANLRAISFQIGENLGADENYRLKKQLRLQRARVGGQDAPAVQEDWEGGFTIFLPEGVGNGQKLEVELLLEGDFMYDAETVENCHYPRSNESWFPRHGYLDRATFNLAFRHPKKLKIASSGLRVSEEPDPEDKNAIVTKYRMSHPVALVTFGLAPFERHTQMVKWEQGGVGDPTPLEFNSLPGSLQAIKEDFIMAELDNSLRYFTAQFGKYPYPTFGATFHPFRFGQGFPTMLWIPATDRDSKYTYVFIAHETAHQWWGDIVLWRSYRDQWLSEGFAEYSGILYTGFRMNLEAEKDLIQQTRESLKGLPRTRTGVGKGRLVDVGPIILGHRLETTKTQGSYGALIYNKGALVLRMLHFLLSDPTTGNGDGFFNMMKDFVGRYHDKIASTDDFRIVAGEHFAKSPIGRQYRLKNLNWFFKQWVYHSEFPSYHMDYQLQDQPDGKVMLSGTITQSNAPADWAMVLPVLISFGGKEEGYATVTAAGPKASFQIRLPRRPKRIELDPHHWILSDKTTTKGN
jgi:Peptidase family M1 domain